MIHLHNSDFLYNSKSDVHLNGSYEIHHLEGFMNRKLGLMNQAVCRCQFWYLTFITSWILITLSTAILFYIHCSDSYKLLIILIRQGHLYTICHRRTVRESPICLIAQTLSSFWFTFLVGMCFSVYAFFRKNILIFQLLSEYFGLFNLFYFLVSSLLSQNNIWSSFDLFTW